MGSSMPKQNLTSDFSNKSDSKGFDSKYKIDIKSESAYKIDLGGEMLTKVSPQKEFSNDPSRQTRLDDCVKNLGKKFEEDQPMNIESSRYPGINGRSFDISTPKNDPIEQNLEQIQDQRLLGEQYYEDTNTLINSDKLVKSFHTNFLKDLSQSFVNEGTQKKQQYQNQADTTSVKAYNKMISENKQDIKEVEEESDEEEDDEFREAPVADDYFSDYLNFDWKQAKFRPQKHKDTQTIFNMINALSCSQINYKSLQAQLNQQVKRNTKVRRTVRQSQYYKEQNKEQSKDQSKE